MPKKIKDLCVKMGSYTDRNGQTKAEWRNVGCVLQMDDNGKMILLNRDFSPAGVPIPAGKEGSGTVAVSMFDPKPRGEQGAANAPKAPPPADDGGFDKEIPF
jgi:hypothetical protein